MVIKMEYKQEKGKIIIKFNKEEREVLDKQMSKLALDVNETKCPLGFNVETPVKYYRNTGNVILHQLSLSGIIDDINKPIYTDGYFNMSVFRFVGENLEFPLKTCYNSSELDDIVYKMKSSFKALMEMSTETEIDISFSFKTSSEKTEVKKTNTTSSSVSAEVLVERIERGEEVIVE